ncbi:MAG: SUF system NifU family Fe-S cluster assembly protein [Candidatus Micrarchaeota archaeon]|nr:SUF system NifU family Fe-S cluster assembly protein [Candidatus Micrarchaeota archaeon]
MSEDIYQEFILELYKNPVNFGKIENADLHEQSFNPLCGDKIEMFIKLDAGRKKIEDVKFIGNGCAISQASASLLTEELKGKTLEEVDKMGKEEIIKMIKIDLSKNPSRLKCAMLGLEVVKKAINTSVKEIQRI